MFILKNHNKVNCWLKVFLICLFSTFLQFLNFGLEAARDTENTLVLLKILILIYSFSHLDYPNPQNAFEFHRLISMSEFYIFFLLLL